MLIFFCKITYLCSIVTRFFSVYTETYLSHLSIFWMISFWLLFDSFCSSQSWLCSPIFLFCLFQLTIKGENSQISTLTLLKVILTFTVDIYNFLSHNLIKNSIYKTKKDLSLQTVFVTEESGSSWLKAYMWFFRSDQRQCNGLYLQASGEKLPLPPRWEGTVQALRSLKKVATKGSRPLTFMLLAYLQW